MMKRIAGKSSVLIVLVLAALACNFGASNQQAAQQATVAALSTTIAGTATAEAANQANPQDSIATAQAEATEVDLSLEATMEAQAIQAQSDQAATETAFAPIKSELPEYGVDPDKGRPGWMHPPLTLELEEFHDFAYGNEFMGTIVEDFAISAEITWNTDYGSSGCGLVFRADGDQEKPSQYMVMATRGASGHVIFATMSKGELVSGRDFYAYGLDPQFDWQNDATNELTVVGRGDSFAIYTNGTLIGEADPNDPLPALTLPPPPPKPADISDPAKKAAFVQAQAEYEAVVTKMKADYAARQKASQTAEKSFARGFTAMVAVSESGHTKCQFDNAWLWLIEE